MSQPTPQPDLLVWIINEFQRLNIAVQVDGTDLLCHPTSELTPELQAAIRQHKPLLVALLSMSVPPSNPRSMLPLRVGTVFEGIHARERWQNALDPSYRRCGTCRYHDADAYVEFHHDDQGGDAGLCRRHPPTPQAIPYDWDDNPKYEHVKSRSELTIFGDWPETLWSAWCGEWERVELPAYHCWYCRHPLIDHTIAPVQCGPRVSHGQGNCIPTRDHGPLRCWCRCELPRLEADQKGAAA